MYYLRVGFVFSRNVGWDRADDSMDGDDGGGEGRDAAADTDDVVSRQFVGEPAHGKGEDEGGRADCGLRQPLKYGFTLQAKF